MPDISTRDDIFLLVTTFYGKVRKEPILGPIFNSIIKNWTEHMELLTDFWETNLFFQKKYHGNPLVKHAALDKFMGGTISQIHFGLWLNLWYETLDELFIGEVTQLAKNRARNMSTYMYIEIFKSRTVKLE